MKIKAKLNRVTSYPHGERYVFESYGKTISVPAQEEGGIPTSKEIHNPICDFEVFVETGGSKDDIEFNKEVQQFKIGNEYYFELVPIEVKQEESRKSIGLPIAYPISTN